MAETLGMLCDKLTIIKLKQYHTEDINRLNSLNNQSQQLQDEIDEYIIDAVTGKIAEKKLTFEANKVYKEASNYVNEVTGGFGELIFHLADVNCRLWHEQEKVYEFENVPIDKKDTVIKQLAKLNIERNKCIDKINSHFSELIVKNK